MLPEAELDKLTLDEHGAQLFRGSALTCLKDLHSIFNGLPSEQAGLRIFGLPGLDPFLQSEGSIGAVATQFLGSECKPVRAILFDKTRDTNWSLAWHQDRVICVKRRIDVEGFGPWSLKGGTVHVAPPFELLAAMVTLRIHLDDVPPDNGPLLIAIGSHHEGKIPIDRTNLVVAACMTASCLARAGDVWAYKTPILHASEAASQPVRRRVLQIDYSADGLPDGLEWSGI